MTRNYAPEQRIGNTHNLLTILAVWGKNKRGEWCYVCHCVCGDFCIVSGSAMELERRKSCGCLDKGRKHKPPKLQRPRNLATKLKPKHNGIELWKAW